MEGRRSKDKCSFILGGKRQGVHCKNKSIKVGDVLIGKCKHHTDKAREKHQRKHGIKKDIKAIIEDFTRKHGEKDLIPAADVFKILDKIDNILEHVPEEENEEEKEEELEQNVKELIAKYDPLKPTTEKHPIKPKPKHKPKT